MWIVAHMFSTSRYYVFSSAFWFKISAMKPDDFILLSIEVDYNAAQEIRQAYEHDYSDRCYLSL